MEQITHILERLRRTLSQSEISRRTGIAQSKISRWEAGNVASGASDAVRLMALDQELSRPELTPTQEAAHG